MILCAKLSLYRYLLIVPCCGAVQQIYECSADICLAARCWPEFLKSITGLTADLYPHLEEKQLQRQKTSAVTATTGAPTAASASAACSEQMAGGWVDREKDLGVCPISFRTGDDRPTAGADDKDESFNGSGSGGRNRSGSGSEKGSGNTNGRATAAGSCGLGSSSDGGGGDVNRRRRGEMMAVHVLFLACMPSGRLADAVAQLRNPQSLSFMAQQSHHDHGLLNFAIQALSSLAAGDWYSFLRLMNGAPKPTLRAVMEIQAPQVRRAGVRSLAAAFRSLPLPAIVEMLQLRCNDDASSITACTFSPVHCRNRARMTCGSWAEAAALRAVLEDAAAAGVRGAQVALEGLSAWGPGCSEFGDVGALPAELAFRS
ncbi:hypothetical protein Vretimale_11622 [Volvox reticuliferus]|uniref:Uncharacterized protein n=1 Tax=Volvox reticuliferus TaxID=1737510 RepID=A0A8J4GHQ9_9CHLO|nr:hypothetical protein Vretifemale_14790 [Volvox reticuliferus]GIM07514.1 hypothetical protein Vretimale_11622 [Volvox reticuliferus]